MTLCIGWRDGEDIFIAADSRINLPDKPPFDEAAKVMPVRMEVEMMNPITGSDEPLFFGNLGLCSSGSTLNALVLRDAITDSIQNLFMPSYDLQKIAAQIFPHYERLSKTLCNVLAGPEGHLAFLLAGWCNESQRYRAFYFRPTSPKQNSYLFSEVLKDSGEYIFFGSGEKRASELYGVASSSEKEKKDIFLRVLKAVIADETVPSVGGKVRKGYFRQTYKRKTREHHTFVSYWA